MEATEIIIELIRNEEGQKLAAYCNYNREKFIANIMNDYKVSSLCAEVVASAIL